MAGSNSGISGFLSRLNKQELIMAMMSVAFRTAVPYLPRGEAHGDRKEEFVIIGLGRFGTSVAVTLASHDYNVLAIDMIWTGFRR